MGPHVEGGNVVEGLLWTCCYYKFALQSCYQTGKHLMQKILVKTCQEAGLWSVYLVQIMVPSGVEPNSSVVHCISRQHQSAIDNALMVCVFESA